MFDLMFNATSKKAWDDFAAANGLVLDFDGATFPASGVMIDEIGPIMVDPPVIDRDGDIITPAVMDEEYHVNLRVDADAADPALLAAGGTGVKWVDPATVTSPARVWAGGMNYWTPGGP